MKTPSYHATCEAIENNTFAHWPEETQTAALKTRGGPQQETPTHWAVANNHFEKIPQKLLTAKTLLTPDKDGYTPLHAAAAYGQLGQIPKDLPTEKNSPDQRPPKIPTSALKRLLQWEHTTKESQEWLKKEILSQRKEKIHQSLQNCNHPDL